MELSDFTFSNKICRFIANYIIPLNAGFIEGSMSSQGLESGYTFWIISGVGGLSALQTASHEVRELSKEATLEDKIKNGFYGAGKGGVKAGLSLSVGYVLGKVIGTLF